MHLLTPRLFTLFRVGLALLSVVLDGCKPAPSGGTSGSSSSSSAAGTAGGGPPMMQVVAVRAVRQPVHESLSLVGTVAANEQVEVKAESEGFVEAIHFSEGQEIARGAVLVTLDETRLRASLEEAEAALNLSRQTYERSKELLAAKLIPQQEYDQSASRLKVDEATVVGKQRALKEALVSAPFKGVVGARLVSPGQLVSRATTLTWLVDLDPVKVEFNVPERFLSQVQAGQEIEVSVAAWPRQRFKGKVFFIAPFVEPDTRTLLVKAQIANQERLLKPGMFASLDLTLEVRNNAIVIPEAGLNQILDGDRATVMVVDAEGTVAMRSVKVGLRMPRRVEIIEGLTGNEQIIVEGLQKIAPGMKVRLAPPESAAPYLEGSA